MHRKWLILLTLLLVGMLTFSALGQADDKVKVTVKIKNSNCSELKVSQFMFIKNNSPLGIKRFFPPRTVRQNHLMTFSFDLSVRPTHLVINGGENGDDFSYRIGLTTGINQRDTSCGRITVEVPYNGGENYPVARFQWSPKQPEPGERVRLDASQSTGNIQLYGWDFDNDGNPDQWQQDPVIFHQWNDQGSYSVSLTVRDNRGRRAYSSNTIRVYPGYTPEPSGLPNVESFNCRDHGYFSRSNRPYNYLEDTNSPPHDQCWGYYKAHIYPLEEFVNNPIILSKITARVTGGMSELGTVKEGFKLQVLRNSSDSWQTLKTFSAPCAAGNKGTLVQWEAQGNNFLRALALRITAPAGGNSLYVDNSAVWIEYYH